MNNPTQDWQLYENGKLYNQRLKPNYYDTVNANLDFYAGNQWRNSESTTLDKPVFNIVKRVLSFFVAQLTSYDTKVSFTPLAFTGVDDMHTEGAEIATAEVENLFEKMKFSNKRRDALFQAGQIGDVAFHAYFDPNKKPYRGNMGMDIQGEICGELVTGTNVFFGNANITDVESQPYIIISGRDMVTNLQAEAKKYKENDSNNITSDSDYNYEAGEAAQIEVQADAGNGKALYIIVYRRDTKTGRIKVSKSVQNAYIYKDIDTGLDRYPVAWLNWEKQINQYHGRAMITGIIPNQIFINKMFAMAMYNMMHTAFPKAVYNADVIDSWNNEIGQAIGVHNFDPNANLGNIATYLEAGNMSSQITGLIDMAMNYTKETLGISDASLGNINPTNTSAIIAVQKSTSIPLENIKHNLYDWVEDIALILVDMMGTYYGTRPVIKKEENDTQSIALYDFNQFKKLWISTKVDVGESSYWSETIISQTLDNLLTQNRIDMIQYLERVPNGFIPEKQQLIDTLKEAQQAQQQAMAQQAPQPNAQYEEMATFFEGLPAEVQSQLKELPPDQFEAAVMDLMQTQ